jgi:hypothetical protein
MRPLGWGVCVALAVSGALALTTGATSSASSASSLKASGAYHFDGRLDTSSYYGGCDIFRAPLPRGPQLSAFLHFKSGTTRVGLTIVLPQDGAYRNFNLASLTKATKGSVKFYAGGPSGKQGSVPRS